MKMTISLIILRHEDKVYLTTSDGGGLIGREGKQKDIAKAMRQKPRDMMRDREPFVLNQIFSQHEKAVWQVPDNIDDAKAILIAFCHQEDGNYIILNQSTFFEQRSGIMVKPELAEKMWKKAEKL